MLSSCNPCMLLSGPLCLVGGGVRRAKRTSRMSSSVIHPGISLLFLKTSREAPMSRWVKVSYRQQQEQREPTCLLPQQALELLPAVIQAFAIRGVHNPDQSVSLLKVVLPVGAEGLLATDIPLGMISTQVGRCGNRTDKYSICSFISLACFSHGLTGRDITHPS